MRYLDNKLENYRDSGVYPFHMPGHKREELPFGNPYGIDITEIEGFDNLHHAEGILKEAQERAANVFRAKKTYYLINGSTCGLLSAISAAVKKQDKILIARNCHKAVYNAAFLNELQIEYLYPQITSAGIQGAVDPSDVEYMLTEHRDITAVIITSPTYDGVVSDVEKIAKIAHLHHVPLIVDEAHGAHFGFHPAFPESSLKKGADVVIQSIHKTLPSFTQTALLHVQTERISTKEIEKYLGIYETSSPSYILMAGMDKCVRLIQEEGNKRFCSYVSMINGFLKKVQELKNIHVLTKKDFVEKEIYDFDMSKIIISVKDCSMSGQELYLKLLNKYKLQMEMASGFYVTAMTSIMDKQEGFDRLYVALHEIDQTIHKDDMNTRDFIKEVYTRNKKDLEIYQAMSLPLTSVELEKAVNETAGAYVYLYPPGIPILVPGERITPNIVDNIKKCGKLQLNIQGMVDETIQRIDIVNF